MGGRRNSVREERQPQGVCQCLSETAVELVALVQVQQQPDFFFEPTLSFLLRFLETSVSTV